jgi:predicted AlkP superfamily phosphohydrolase/phosphomutase
MNTRQTETKRLLIIGLDSATFDVIDPWAKDGRLPNLSRLLQEGATSNLESVPNMNSAPAWSSIATGKNSGKHGIFWFVEDDPEHYDYQYINASFRTAKPVWQILSEAGKRVGVINVPMSYPAEPLEGFLIAGLDAPSPEAPSFSYPPDLFPWLRQELGEYIIEPGLPSLMKAERLDKAENLLYKTISQRQCYARHLITEEQWDVFFVVFTALDSAQHFFWKYMEPKRFDVSPEEVGRYGQVILNVHQMLDDAIGELVELAGPDTRVMILSDHGMGATDSRNKLLPYWLESLGLLAFEGNEAGLFGSPIQQGRKMLLDALVAAFRQVDKRLTREAKMKLARAFPQLRKMTEIHMQIGRIDWSRTKAYANGKRSEIWINLKGRQPQGTVEPGMEYDELCTSIDEKLRAARDPETGEPYVERVVRRDEVYSGAWVHRSPDLIVRWHRGGWIDNYVFGDRTGLEIKRIISQQDPIARLGSGHHTPQGILILHGEGIRPGVRIEGACVYDIAPTVLYLMGLPIPSDMDGQVLTRLLEEDLPAAHPIRTVAAEETEAGDRQIYTDEEEQIIGERLRNLGYVE